MCQKPFFGGNFRYREGVVIDAMGIAGRKKSILASYHGRCHTMGVANLRVMSTDMSPLYSGCFRSTDS